MSLILDALRKMELERKARRQSSPEMRAEVLSYRGGPSLPGRETRPWLIAVLVACAAVAAVGGFVYSSKKAVRDIEPVQQPQPQSGAAVAPVAPVPQQPSTGPALPLVSPASAPLPAAVRPATATHEQPVSGGAENIVISGIAWQEERSLRRAVINGSLVGEGSEVLGVTVVEIREREVRFRRGGETFDIIYSGNGR
jgi:general secretion pathway protein B